MANGSGYGYIHYHWQNYIDYGINVNTPGSHYSVNDFYDKAKKRIKSYFNLNNPTNSLDDYEKKLNLFALSMRKGFKYKGVTPDAVNKIIDSLLSEKLDKTLVKHGYNAGFQTIDQGIYKGINKTL